ncbi:MAG TPA: ADP-ribosylglycohydrolase family protein [Candidatus Hydrogenedentes bacterium]|nr:ADP-ribosylglycohydrolase family protein [Candidatus Hydrogenedentota bacterium]
MATLGEKFNGCIAGAWVGSAMGAAVEGWPPERIRETYGFLDTLLPYRHYTDRTDWERPAGTTEDGIERQRLMATAIIQKQDRILAHDLVRVWLRDLDPEKMIYKQEPFDRSLLELARAGVPPSELGRLWPFPNVVSVSRASHPLGLINAGDPGGAADDTFEVGKVYFRETAFGLRWAALYNAAVAEACTPGATVASVIETAKRFVHYRAEAGTLYSLYDTIEREVAHALALAEKHTDPMAMRDEFYELYRGGDYFNYGQSQANEVVSKGLAIFALSDGNPKDAILTAVNFGRDTDCLAAVAGGLAGALSGAEAIPKEWIDQVDEATSQDPYTNSRRTVEETTEGLYEAFVVRRKRLEEYLRLMNAPGFLDG